MSHWFVYWILMLDSMCMAVGIIWVLTLIFTSIFIIAISICISDSCRDEKGGLIKIRNKTLKWCAIIFGVTFFISTFLPGTKQMAAIYLLPKIAANKDIQQLPPKLSKLALEYVNKELNLEEKK